MKYYLVFLVTLCQKVGYQIIDHLWLYQPYPAGISIFKGGRGVFIRSPDLRFIRHFMIIDLEWKEATKSNHLILWMRKLSHREVN